MMARLVMLAWYMCSFEIFYGIWTSIAKKLYFCDFPGGVGGQGSYASGKCQCNLNLFKVRELSGNFMLCQGKINDF